MLIAMIIVLIIVIVAYWRLIVHKIGGPTLYDRLGGVYSIAAVVNHFSDALISNPIVGRDSPNEKLRDWHMNQLTRLPGLKFMRTLWVCDKAGGPYVFTPTVGCSLCPFSSPLGAAHARLTISPVEFDAVAAELGRSLDYFSVPEQEKKELLGVFAAHKSIITGN